MSSANALNMKTQEYQCTVTANVMAKEAFEGMKQVSNLLLNASCNSQRNNNQFTKSKKETK